MMRPAAYLFVAVLPALFAMQSCASPPTDAAAGKTIGMPATPQASVAGLPFAQGRAFATLDAYLAFLKERSAADIPFYEEAEPGLYRLNRGLAGRGAEPQTFTRAELAARFGFPD